MYCYPQLCAAASTTTWTDIYQWRASERTCAVLRSRLLTNLWTLQMDLFTLISSCRECHFFYSEVITVHLVWHATPAFTRAARTDSLVMNRHCMFLMSSKSYSTPAKNKTWLDRNCFFFFFTWLSLTKLRLYQTILKPIKNIGQKTSVNIVPVQREHL